MQGTSYAYRMQKCGHDNLNEMNNSNKRQFWLPHARAVWRHGIEHRVPYHKNLCKQNNKFGRHIFYFLNNKYSKHIYSIYLNEWAYKNTHTLKPMYTILNSSINFQNHLPITVRPLARCKSDTVWCAVHAVPLA